METQKNIRAIIVDLDRTLLRSDKTISPYTATVLKTCKQRGIKIIVATARPQRNVMQFCDIVDFDGLVVSNGARIIFRDQRQEFRIRPKNAEHLLRA